MPDPDIECRTLEGVTVVAVTGEVDFSGAAELERAVSDEGGSTGVVADLTGVTFIDSTGLRALVSARDALAAGSRPLALAVGEPVARLLSLTALDRDFRIFPSVDEAIAAGR